MNTMKLVSLLVVLAVMVLPGCKEKVEDPFPGYRDYWLITAKGCTPRCLHAQYSSTKDGWTIGDHPDSKCAVCPTNLFGGIPVVDPVSEAKISKLGEERVLLCSAPDRNGNKQMWGWKRPRAPEDEVLELYKEKRGELATLVDRVFAVETPASFRVFGSEANCIWQKQLEDQWDRITKEMERHIEQEFQPLKQSSPD